MDCPICGQPLQTVRVQSSAYAPLVCTRDFRAFWPAEAAAGAGWRGASVREAAEADRMSLADFVRSRPNAERRDGRAAEAWLNARLRGAAGPRS